MPSSSSARSRYAFAGFVFDPANARLVHGGESIAMRPKTVALLVELTARAGELVGKDELMLSVWPETAVTDSVLAGAVQELRRILGDDPRHPRIIETVHRRGYRFIAGIDEPQAQATVAVPAAAPRRTAIAEAAIVGRRQELATLEEWLGVALGGQGLIGFVVGEAGMGKTTLVGAFCERAAQLEPALRIGTGHGVEWTSQAEGSVDPYVPILEALGQACGGPGGEATIAVLRRYAPSWLPLLPGLLDPAAAAPPTALALRTTRERLALELSSFLDALPQPLLLVFEDLHWSDASTLDLLTAVARRSLRAPLLVLATYRAAGAAVRRHPVRAAHQTLLARGRCRDLWLKPFERSEIESCLLRKWPGIDASAAGVIAGVLLQKTDGNPLFVTGVIDTLEGERFSQVQGAELERVVTELTRGIPPGLAQMIDAEMGRLRDEDRMLLEAGSLSGMRFSAETVAAVTASEVVDVEERLDELSASGGTLRQLGEEVWPDGSVATRYEFVHALYGDVLRSRVSAANRRRGHRRIAERLQSAWKGREAEIAAELAFHFHAAGASQEAVPFVELAATAASRVGAHIEAAGFLERGIEALEVLPPTPERRRDIMRLCITLGQIRQAPDGFNAQKAEAAYARALEVARALGSPHEEIVPTLALTSAFVAQGRLADAERNAEQARTLLERFPVPPLQFLGDVTIAQVLHHKARLDEAREMLERAIAYSGPEMPIFVNFRIHALNYLGLTLMHLGRPDSSRERAFQAMTLAKDAGLPFDRASAAGFACFGAILVRDRRTLELAAPEAEKLGGEYGFLLPGTVGTFARGLLLRMDGQADEGIAVMTEATRHFERSGYISLMPTLMSVIADSHLAEGRADEAMSFGVEARAAMDRSGDLRFRAEFTRIEAQAALLRGELAAAQAGFEKALQLARGYGLGWQELRAATGLARTMAKHAKRADGLALLEPVAAGIDEGTQLPDAVEARALLAALG